jgi:hypothetical protein
MSENQLLHMASGVKHIEAGPEPERADTNRALFADTSADIYKAAAAQTITTSANGLKPFVQGSRRMPSRTSNIPADSQSR